MKKINFYSYILISICLFLYFSGYFFREISNGAGHTDLQKHIWLLLNDFNKDYINTLKNYLIYKEATFPFFHTLQHIFNPFKQTVFGYTLSNTIFNLVILFIFYHYIKKKEIFGENRTLIILIPFIFLLSPWFRSTSYWGLTENFAILFLIPACFYFNKLIQKEDFFKTNILLTIFLSLTIYSRQQYIYLVFSHLIIILFLDRNLKNIITTLLIYFILSLPGLYTYYLWGVHENLSNATHSFEDLYSLGNIIQNIPKISSILLFYTIPIIIFNYKNFFNILRKKTFILSFVLIYFIEFLLFKDLKYDTQGGGFIIKFYKIFLNENNYFLIFISSLFFSLAFTVRKEINKEYYLILFFVFITIGLTITLYQEWFDPIYIILYYLLLPNNLISKIRISNQNFLFFLYFWEFMILLIAIIYYHFYLKIPFFYNF